MVCVTLLLLVQSYLTHWSSLHVCYRFFSIVSILKHPAPSGDLLISRTRLSLDWKVHITDNYAALVLSDLIIGTSASIPFWGVGGCRSLYVCVTQIFFWITGWTFFKLSLSKTRGNRHSSLSNVAPTFVSHVDCEWVWLHKTIRSKGRNVHIDHNNFMWHHHMVSWDNIWCV